MTLKTLSGSSMRFLATENLSLTLPAHFVSLEPRQPVAGLTPSEERQVYLPGSGMATSLLEVRREEGKVEAVVLSKFCEEGDNSGDGMEVADYSNQLLGWSPDRRYRPPHSWTLLFGPPPPRQMFW